MSLKAELQTLLPFMSEIIKTSEWSSLLIDHKKPVIHRLFTEVRPGRTLYLHRLFHTGNENAFMHSHSWNLACALLSGQYEHGIGFASERDATPKISFRTITKAGDIYEVCDPNLFHYTKPIECTETYSVMLVGPRTRPRTSLNNSELNVTDQTNLLNWSTNYFGKEMNDS